MTAGVTGPGGESKGRREAFVSRLDPTGSLLSCGQFGSDHFDMATRIRFFSNGDLAIVGNARESFEGQRWAGSIHPKTYAEAYDIFVTRRNPDGDKIWTRLVGTKVRATPMHGGDEAWGLVVDGEDRVHVAGYLGGPHGKNRAPGGVSGVLLEYSPRGKRTQTRYLNHEDGAHALYLARRAQDGRIAFGGFSMAHGDRMHLVHTWSRGAKRRLWRYEELATAQHQDKADRTKNWFASSSIRGMHWRSDGDLELLVCEVIWRHGAFDYEPRRLRRVVLDADTGRVKESVWYPSRTHITATTPIDGELLILDARGRILVAGTTELRERSER